MTERFDKIVLFDNLLNDLAENFGVSKRLIFDALFILLGDNHDVEWAGDLMDVEISFDNAKKILLDFDFSIFINEIILDESIVPKEIAFLRKALVKVKGEIWVIHKYDVDPYPSNPHAHNLEQNIKLHLGNGNLYRNKVLEGKVKKKELLIIREKAEKVYNGGLPNLEI